MAKTKSYCYGDSDTEQTCGYVDKGVFFGTPGACDHHCPSSDYAADPENKGKPNDPVKPDKPSYKKPSLKKKKKKTNADVHPWIPDTKGIIIIIIGMIIMGILGWVQGGATGFVVFQGLGLVYIMGYLGYKYFIQAKPARTINPGGPKGPTLSKPEPTTLPYKSTCSFEGEDNIRDYAGNKYNKTPVDCNSCNQYVVREKDGGCLSMTFDPEYNGCSDGTCPEGAVCSAAAGSQTRICPS